MTQTVNGRRVFAQPEIDGGTFFASNGSTGLDDVLIITRFSRSVETMWVQSIASSGVIPTLGTKNQVPAPNLFTQVSGQVVSVGAFIPASQLSAGTQYAWGAFGVGG